MGGWKPATSDTRQRGAKTKGRKMCQKRGIKHELVFLSLIFLLAKSLYPKCICKSFLAIGSKNYKKEEKAPHFICLKLILENIHFTQCADIIRDYLQLKVQYIKSIVKASGRVR